MFLSRLNFSIWFYWKCWLKHLANPAFSTDNIVEHYILIRFIMTLTDSTDFPWLVFRQGCNKNKIKSCPTWWKSGINYMNSWYSSSRTEMGLFSIYLRACSESYRRTSDPVTSNKVVSRMAALSETLSFRRI